jgi:hypothetical protein
LDFPAAPGVKLKSRNVYALAGQLRRSVHHHAAVSLAGVMASPSSAQIVELGGIFLGGA